MKNNSFTSIIHRLFAVSAALILLMAQSTGCSKEDPEELGILDISDVVLLDQIYTSIGSEVSISGRGFESGDVVVLRPVLTGSAEYTAPAVLVTSTEIVFVVPDGLTSGEYKVYVSRNGQNLLLGRTTFNLLSDIPDKAGMNIKGIVTCNGGDKNGCRRDLLPRIGQKERICLHLGAERLRSGSFGYDATLLRLPKPVGFDGRATGFRTCEMRQQSSSRSRLHGRAPGPARFGP